MALITLATDYGSSDGYNAAVIGVIKSLAPSAEIIEITNSLTTIVEASLVLLRYYAEFPKGTIHLVVVDPSVGSTRRALMGTDGNSYFVGPDNGIFTRVMDTSPTSVWYEIDTAKLAGRRISPTFHGRDIFAPATAMLAWGVMPENIGNRITDPIRLDIPKPKATRDRIFGEIIDIDTFGNLIINIPGKSLKNPRLVLKKKTIPFEKTFSDVKPGRPVAYIGSLGLLEIAVNDGRAAKYFNARIGTKVTVII